MAPGAGTGCCGGGGGGGGGRDGPWARCRSVGRAFFSSAPYHSSVIALVLIDLAAVVIDLGVMIAHCPEPHLKPGMERALEALTWISVGILCLFVVEFAAQILCFGLRWCRVPANLLDASVVSLSLALELALRRSDLKDVVGLLIAFRLWRIARIVHATEEIFHIEHHDKLHAAEEEAKALRGELEAARAELLALRAAAGPKASLSAAAAISMAAADEAR